MEIQTVTVEFLRAGPRHNQLLSPITPYLGICGNSAASRVTIPYEHREIERRLQELRYGVTDGENRRRASEVLEQTGGEIAQVLSSVNGLTGMLSPKLDQPQILTHLRIVLSASELAMLPFEASKKLGGSSASAGGDWLVLQSRAPVCITRHIRSVSADAVPWPTKPRILFIAGPETPVSQHRKALSDALHPWRDKRGEIDHLLEVLENPRVEHVTRIFRAAVLDGAPFTHVHVLAHGVQVDERDRYSSVGLAISDSEEPISGGHLASALTAVGPAGAIRPAVVTLASCDSGQQVDVRTTEAAIAHELHDRGIPLVIASQFPMTVEGSVPFVARFFEGQLRGKHPLESLFEVRLELHATMDPETHDWASLVVYEALPSNLPEQLQSLCYWQARRAQEGALTRLEALTEGRFRGDDTTSARNDAIKSVDATSVALPTSGAFSLESAGLRAAAHKRIAFSALQLAATSKEGTQIESLMAECRRRLNDARAEYWLAAKGFLAPSTELLRRKANLHWLLGQVIALDVALGQEIDESLLTAACLAAEIDRDSGDAVERAWAHVSLTEFNLLRLANVHLPKDRRKEIAAAVHENARTFVELLGPDSEQISTTSRQIDRYVSWWGNPERQPLLTRLRIPERAHWHVENGLIPTAVRVLKFLRQNMSGQSDKESRSRNESPAIDVATSAQPQEVLRVKRSAHQLLAVEMLPAENGDCLLLEYGDRSRLSRVLIDCGAKSTVPIVARRLSEVGGRKPIPLDLFVLTHIDADHINGVLSLFDQAGLKLNCNDIWFNGWRQINRFLGVRQAEAFSELLENAARRLPWNLAFTGKGAPFPGPVVMADESDPPAMELPGGMKLTLLSPGPLQLKRLAKDWKQALLKLNPPKALLGRRLPPEPVRDFSKFDLRPLSETPDKRDPSTPNGSSIAMLAEFAGRSVLLTGDAHADVLVKSISALQRSRGRAGERLKIDALKLSHHGSANATTIQLLDSLECRHYLVSTNGNYHYHPDRQSIARVILHGGLRPMLHFNYRTEFNKLWDAPELKDRYGYVARYPDDNASGLRVEL